MLITIAVMGILLAIASGTWFRIVESRTLDSAASQLSSDLRLAHTRAANQLTDWQVQVFLGRGDQSLGPDYKLVRPSDNLTFERSLPEKSMISSTEIDNSPSGDKILRFRSTGAVESLGGFTDADSDGQIRITVSVDGDPSRGVTVVPATSRVKIVL